MPGEPITFTRFRLLQSSQTSREVDDNRSSSTVAWFSISPSDHRLPDFQRGHSDDAGDGGDDANWAGGEDNAVIHGERLAEELRCYTLTKEGEDRGHVGDEIIRRIPNKMDFITNSLKIPSYILPVIIPYATRAMS